MAAKRNLYLKLSVRHKQLKDYKNSYFPLEIVGGLRRGGFDFFGEKLVRIGLT